MSWMWSRSTSSWVLVRDCAGTPPESPTKSSTLRPASVLFFSFRYCTSARSMSMPPEASGPVFTVIRPSRIGPACAFPRRGMVVKAEAPVAWMKRLRLKRMFLLLQFFEELPIRDDPAEAARNVLQPQHVKIVAVHAGDAVGQHHHAVAVVERGEGRVQHASVGIDPQQDRGLYLQHVEQVFEVRVVEAIEALLAVDDVVALPIELGNDLGAPRALDVVLAYRALAARHEAVGLRLRRVHRLPERRHHRVGAHARDAAMHEDHMEDRDLQAAGEIQRLPAA